MLGKGDIENSGGPSWRTRACVSVASPSLVMRVRPEEGSRSKQRDAQGGLSRAENKNVRACVQGCPFQRCELEQASTQVCLSELVNGWRLHQA